MLPRTVFKKGHIGYFKGRKFTKEHREKISIAQRGRYLSFGTREKISLALKGRKLSPEHCKKISMRLRTGVRNINGRVFIYKPNHPGKNSRGFVRRSRIIMENKLGRYLLPTEVIHHKDSNLNNDNINNLQLFSNNGEHRKLHKQPRNEKGKFTHLVAS